MKKQIGINLTSLLLCERMGGPSTYLYNLKIGLQRIGVEDIFVVSSAGSFDKNPSSNNNNIAKRTFKELMKLILINSFPRIFSTIRIHKISKYGERFFRWAKSYLEFLSSEYNLKFIHFHSVLDLYSLSKSLKTNLARILTSHSPEAYHVEYSRYLEHEIERYTMINSKKEKIVQHLSEYWRKIDEIAFKTADYLMFPCEESIEPYLETWREFDRIISEKRIFFVPTGSPPLKVTEDALSFREKLGIPRDAFVVSYVGRHIEVKGYDLLCSAAEIVWSKNPKIYFLIAGKEEPLKGLKDDRWIELGWTNEPGNVINAANVFVLPNRRTYFDLVLLEAMSLGKVVIASYTGGNKFVAKQTRGIVTFQPLTDFALAKAILELSSCSPETLERLGQENFETYSKFYTVESFAKRYREAVGKIFFGE